MKKYLEFVSDDHYREVLKRNINFSKLKYTNILVTGASGFIGFYIINVLLCLNNDYGYNINVIALVRDNANSSIRFENLKSRSDLIIIKGDVVNCPNIDYEIDYVIHGASPASPNMFESIPVDTIAANTVGTFNMLRLAVEKKVKRLAYLSTALIYKQFVPPSVFETDSINPNHIYPLSKFTGEMFCRSFQNQYGIECVSYRLIGIYGPGYPYNFGTSTSEFSICAKEGQDIIIKGNGLTITPHCYISDAVDAIFRGLLSDKNIVVSDVAGHNISLLEWAESFKKYSGKIDVKVLNQETPHKAPEKFNEDNLKNIGWENKISLDEGVRRMLDAMHEVEQ